MSDATVIGLAKGVKTLIQIAIDDPAHPLGDLTFDLKRVAFIKQWVLNDDDGTIRIRVATHGTESNEEARLSYGVNYVIPVAVLRKLKAAEMDGQSIDGEDAELLAVSDAMTELVELLTQMFSQRVNWFTGGSPGPRFVRWTHRDRSNPDGLIFNPAGLKERRQYESTIFLHFAAEFSA